MDDPTQLDPSTLQNLLGNSQTSLIPESLVTTLTVSFIVLNVLGVLFMVFYVMGIVRKWRVQSAILDMRKDLAEIKAQIASQPAKFDPVVPTPAAQNQIIAQEEPDNPTPRDSNMS